jgi:hypothetical protein
LAIFRKLIPLLLGIGTHVGSLWLVQQNGIRILEGAG